MEVSCPQCMKSLNISEENYGEKICCPECNLTFNFRDTHKSSQKTKSVKPMDRFLGGLSIALVIFIAIRLIPIIFRYLADTFKVLTEEGILGLPILFFLFITFLALVVTYRILKYTVGLLFAWGFTKLTGNDCLMKLFIKNKENSPELDERVNKIAQASKELFSNPDILSRSQVIKNVYKYSQNAPEDDEYILSYYGGDKITSYVITNKHMHGNKRSLP